MALVKLEIAPGVYRNATPYQGSARWYDTNLVRWVDGLMMPVGGWQKFSQTQLVGTCRGLFSWRDNSGFRWLAIGTNSRLYVHDDGELINITPTGFSAGGGTSALGYGYGVGPYSDSTYGTPRVVDSGLVLDAATWSFDAWGENLVGCCTSDGKLYEWAPDDAQAAVIANAPTQNAGVLVSEQRHLIALGAGGDPRRVAWSDAEDNTDWTPSSTNQAGDFLLNTAGHIKSAVKVRGEIIILTSVDVHAMRFIGSPLVFQFERIGTNCGTAGPKADVFLDSGLAWFGSDARIYLYNGVVQQVPCDVQDWLEEQFDKLRASEVYGGTLSEHGEAWWFFPANDGETKYVIWNYRTNLWSIGELDRTAWLDRGVWRYPIGVSSDGYLYQHEDGMTDSGQSRVGTIYAESGGMEIAPGDRIADIMQVIPDEGTNGDVRVTFKCKYTPNGTETTYGPYTVRSDGYTDTRASGRQAKLRIEAVEDSDWRVGTFRADVKLGAMR